MTALAAWAAALPTAFGSRSAASRSDPGVKGRAMGGPGGRAPLVSVCQRAWRWESMLAMSRPSCAAPSGQQQPQRSPDIAGRVRGEWGVGRQSVRTLPPLRARESVCRAGHSRAGSPQPSPRTAAPSPRPSPAPPPHPTDGASPAAGAAAERRGSRGGAGGGRRSAGGWRRRRRGARRAASAAARRTSS